MDEYNIIVLNGAFEVEGTNPAYCGRFELTGDREIVCNCPGSITVAYPKEAGLEIGALKLMRATNIKTIGLKLKTLQVGTAEHVHLKGIQVQKNNFVSVIKGISINDLHWSSMHSPEIQVSKIKQMNVVIDAHFNNKADNVFVSERLNIYSPAQSVVIQHKKTRQLQIYTNILKNMENIHVSTLSSYEEFYENYKSNNFIEGTSMMSARYFLEESAEHFHL